MEQTLYPFTFEPIFKERIWGGTKLHTFLHKSILSKTTGESWEMSTVSNDISIISNGIYQGKSLNELIEAFPEAILGKDVFKRFGKQFPLLFKYLDANQDLSIQVHPNDRLAKERHNSFGKTEMWYVLQADEGARLIVGFKQDTNRELYTEALANKSLLTLLEEIPVQKGDVFLLETGTVHAIGGGVLLAEIQQTSDVTYRLYDWDRVDADGQARTLHTELALDAINFKSISPKQNYQAQLNKAVNLVDCPYFKTEMILLTGAITIKNPGDSFLVLMCVEGSFELTLDNTSYSFALGETILLPAALAKFELHGKATLLKIMA